MKEDTKRDMDIALQALDTAIHTLVLTTVKNFQSMEQENLLDAIEGMASITAVLEANHANQICAIVGALLEHENVPHYMIADQITAFKESFQDTLDTALREMIGRHNLPDIMDKRAVQ